jgi:hypothetical protein
MSNTITLQCIETTQLYNFVKHTLRPVLLIGGELEGKTVTAFELASQCLREGMDVTIIAERSESFRILAHFYDPDFPDPDKLVEHLQTMMRLTYLTPEDDFKDAGAYDNRKGSNSILIIDASLKSFEYMQTYLETVEQRFDHVFITMAPEDVRRFHYMKKCRFLEIIGSFDNRIKLVSIDNRWFTPTPKMNLFDPS